MSRNTETGSGRLKRVVNSHSPLSANSSSKSRALTNQPPHIGIFALSREHLRLAESRPADLQATLTPLLAVITQHLSAGMEAGAIRRDDPRRMARCTRSCWRRKVLGPIPLTERVWLQTFGNSAGAPSLRSSVRQRAIFSERSARAPTQANFEVKLHHTATALIAYVTLSRM